MLHLSAAFFLWLLKERIFPLKQTLIRQELVIEKVLTRHGKARSYSTSGFLLF